MTGLRRLRQVSVRAVEYPFLVVERDFGFTATRYRGLAKNLNHLNVLFASANWLMRARAVALMGRRQGARMGWWQVHSRPHRRRSPPPQARRLARGS